MLVARTRQLSLFAHAVDDFGALCGARPVGDWIQSKSLPLTCPRCLAAMSRPRYSLCEAPRVHLRLLHIRQVGAEGMARRSLPQTRTLCGAAAGWDLGAVRPLRRGENLCPVCRRAFRDQQR